MVSLNSTCCATCGRPFEVPRPNTKRQQQIVSFIARFHEEQGVYPTLREIAIELRVSATAVHKHIDKLVQMGVLTKTRHAARSICFVEGSQR